MTMVIITAVHRKSAFQTGRMETLSFVIVREDVVGVALEEYLDLDTESHNFCENAIIDHHLSSVTVY